MHRDPSGRICRAIYIMHIHRRADQSNECNVRKIVSRSSHATCPFFRHDLANSREKSWQLTVWQLSEKPEGKINKKKREFLSHVATNGGRIALQSPRRLHQSGSFPPFWLFPLPLSRYFSYSHSSPTLVRACVWIRRIREFVFFFSRFIISCDDARRGWSLEKVRRCNAKVSWLEIPLMSRSRARDYSIREIAFTREISRVIARLGTYC